MIITKEQIFNFLVPGRIYQLKEPTWYFIHLNPDDIETGDLCVNTCIMFIKQVNIVSIDYNQDFKINLEFLYKTPIFFSFYENSYMANKLLTKMIRIS